MESGLLLVAVSLNLPQPRPVKDLSLGNHLLCYFGNNLTLFHVIIFGLPDKYNFEPTESTSLRTIGDFTSIQGRKDGIDTGRG
jgi:hypothetical protein